MSSVTTPGPEQQLILSNPSLSPSCHPRLQISSSGMSVWLMEPAVSGLIRAGLQHKCLPRITEYYVLYNTCWWVNLELTSPFHNWRTQGQSYQVATGWGSIYNPFADWN